MTDAIERAIEFCEQWFAYLERQKQDSITLQKAATLARSGDREGARRLKSQVDSAPRVFDGSRLYPAVKTLIDHQKTHISIARDDVAEYFVEPYGSYAPSQSDLENVFLLVQNKVKEG